MKPSILAPLDPQFRPMALEMRDYREMTARLPSCEIALTVEREKGLKETMRMTALQEGVEDARTCAYFERIVKSMLWMYGGFRVYVAGSRVVYDHIAACYQPGGARAFDRDFMARIYERDFEVRYLPNAADAPASVRASSAAGRHLDGCRIGFDAGGSDRKVSAVINGEAVYSEEVVWHPKLNADPAYQYEGILSSMRTAAAHMPRVDAIGVSSAGVYVNNRVMAASLFLLVPPELFEKRVKSMYIDIAREIGENIPLEVANDGDVTALAGAMELNDNCVLGVAMGTSEAGGYVDENGCITGWLNELAFVPVDAHPDAMIDEWSGDIGCGVKYFSQDAVIKLAPAAGIPLEEELSPAEKLKVVQGLMARGDTRARAIYRTIGVYFGYGIAYYAAFYNIRHVLIMGRVTSGEGGVVLLEAAKEALRADFPALYEAIELHIPDESSRRVGQSIAAASLPQIG